MKPAGPTCGRNCWSQFPLIELMNRRIWLAWLLSALFLYGLAIYSPVSNSNSDPELTLVVSQAVLEEGTIYLDAYQDRLALSRDFAGYRATSNILEQNGHYLNYFPVGPSLFALPFVAAARWLDQDMTLYSDNDATQNVLSGLTIVMVFGLLFILACCYVNEWVSLGLALVFVLGTGVISTMGTAFWTHNLSVPIFLLALWLLARYETEYTATIHPYLLGLLIFGAYVCRAAAVAFILPLFLYLLLRVATPLLSHSKLQPTRHRFTQVWPTIRLPLADLIKVVLSSALCLTFFFFWWRLATGQWVPAYFSVARFQVERSDPLTALAGLLISPGRGLFVYSPFLVMIVFLALWLAPALKQHRLRVLVLVWGVLHVAIIVRAASWWGGASFGPRLLVDLLPAWFLLAVWGWRTGQRSLWPRTQTTLLLIALPLVAWSIYLNSYQGLFNEYMGQWDIEMVNQPEQQELFDWRYPPFRASPGLFCQRDDDLVAQWLGQVAPTLGVYRLGDVMRPQQSLNLTLPYRLTDPSPPIIPSPHTIYLPLLNQSTAILLAGWSPLVGDFSWSKCPSATVYLSLGEVDPAQTYQLIWQGATLGQQTITLRINDVPVETFIWKVSVNQPEERAWLIPGSLLRAYEFNRITFDLPDARPANEIDNRPLALAFFALRLEVMEGMRPQNSPPPLPYP